MYPCLNKGRISDILSDLEKVVVVMQWKEEG